MLQWSRTLPSSRRLSLSSLAPIRLPHTRHVSFSPFLRPSPYSRLSFRRPIIWLLPVVGGVSIYFYPRPQPSSSSTLIPRPSNDNESPTSSESLILSPSELHLSLPERIYTLFLDHIWEPILTTRRFIHLFFLFAPVIISSPMLLVGSPEERLQGDRWGAVWWYGYLVAQMDRAGPTFIKVRSIVPLFCIRLTRRSLAACSVGSLARRFISCVVV